MKNEIVTGSGDMLFSQHKVSLGEALVGRQVMTRRSCAEHRCLKWFIVSPSVNLVCLLTQEEFPCVKDHSFIPSSIHPAYNFYIIHSDRSDILLSVSSVHRRAPCSHIKQWISPFGKGDLTGVWWDSLHGWIFSWLIPSPNWAQYSHIIILLFI